MQPAGNKVWYLRRLDLFASLTHDEIEALAQSLDDRLLPAGTDILQHHRRERLYVIKTGAVRLYTDDQVSSTQFFRQCVSFGTQLVAS